LIKFSATIIAEAQLAVALTNQRAVRTIDFVTLVARSVCKRGQNDLPKSF
jgi:hypothetical protein